MNILVINGPNMNMLGIRQPEIYGRETYEDLKAMIQAEADKLGVTVSFFQSNHEGALVDAIQQAYFDHVDGIIINPGGLHPHQRGPAGCSEICGHPHGGGPRVRSGQPGGVPACLLHPGGLRGHHPGPRPARGMWRPCGCSAAPDA